MRTIFCSLVFVGCLLVSTGKDYGQGGRPIPPGIREADKQTNAPIEATAPTSKPKKADPAQLEREAQELAGLSAQIPVQIAAVNHGQMPKDLTEQLKQIEKLAKRLRMQVVP